MAEEQPQEQTNYFVADTNIKLRDLEEKQNLIRDRILLIGENLISEKQETNEELVEIKNKLKTLEQETNKIKLVIQRIGETQNDFARKSEVEILQRQFKMFQPLEFARMSDVKEMIKEALEKRG